MRLLNVSTREVEEFHGNIPQYAILSHTWGPEEVSMSEMEAIARYRRLKREPAAHIMPRSADNSDTMKLMLLHTMLMAFRGHRSHLSQAATLPALTNGNESEEDERINGRMVPSGSPQPLELKAGYSKITYACGQAEKDGYRYVWVDTCCIDKRSSAEVSEAINSMFSWYQRAAVCYAYLEDVHFDNYTEGYLTWKDHFNTSRWFTRGWTLQELLAPRKVVFYAKGWRLLGTKSSLVKSIEKITGIDQLTLLEPKLIANASVAQRMSWAAHRTATRPEDMAYSLLGVFGVNIPIIYGEGENAFLRLQEEIIKRSDDHSIFAWGTLGHEDTHLTPHHPIDLDDLDFDDMTGTTGVLATSPREFAGMEHVVTSPPSAQATTDYAMTNKGLRIQLDLARTNDQNQTPTTTTTPTANHYLAILNTHTEHDGPKTRLALLLTETTTPNVFIRTRTRNATIASPTDQAMAKPRLIYIPNTTAHIPRSKLAEEVIFVRAPDLAAPGYDVLDIRGPSSSSQQQAQWNKEFGSIRLTGVDYGNVSRGGNMGENGTKGVLFQLAVVTFWNRHLGCGFVVRVLVDGASKVVFMDLLQGRGQDAGEGVGVKEGLVEQARRVWERPGSVEVTVPTSRTDTPTRKTVVVDVINPVAGEVDGEDREFRSDAEGTGWSFRPGHEIMVSGSVTFTERWERDYQRTVNAKVERKKKGVIELSMSSMLWQAAPVADDLDQPS